MQFRYKTVAVLIIVFGMFFWIQRPICQTLDEDTTKKSTDSLKVKETTLPSEEQKKIEEETDTLEKQIQSVVSNIQKKERALEEKEVQLEKKEKQLNRLQRISWILFAVGIVALGLSAGIIWFPRKSKPGTESQRTSAAKKK